MRRPRRLLLIAPIGLLAGACDDMVDLRVQAQQICVTATGEAFSGSSRPPGPLPFPGGSVTPVRMSFDRPLLEVPGRAAGLGLDARFDSVTIRSTSDLTFIKKVLISLEPGKPGDMLPSLPIGEWARGPGATAMPTQIHVPSTLESNVWKYLVGAPARLRFLVTGKLPTEAFAVDVEACIYVQGQVTRP